MRRLLAFLSLLAAGPARGDMKAPAPVPQRVAETDLAIIAKVVSIEEKPVEMPAVPGGKEKVAWKVAVIEVQERLAGRASSKKVRLAFLPPSGRRRFGLLDPKPGQEALFFLARRHGTRYYQARRYFDVVGKAGNPRFADVAAQARRAGGLLADPKKGLQSKDAAQRVLTAGLLITRWDTPPLAAQKDRKQAAVPAALGKLALEALAEADWTKPEFSQFSPRQLFLRLRLTEKDGWKAKGLASFNDEAKAWLKANAAKHKLKRWTTGATAEP